MRFNHRGIRLNFNLLGDGADGQCDGDCRVAVHLEDDSTLHIGVETGEGRFQTVRSNRKIGYRVRSGFIRQSRTHIPGLRLRDFHLYTGQQRS